MKLAVNNFLGTWTQWKLWYTARILCFKTSFKRNCTISTGIPNLKLCCKKTIQLNFRSWTKTSDSNS